MGNRTYEQGVKDAADVARNMPDEEVVGDNGGLYHRPPWQWDIADEILCLLSDEAPNE